MSDENRALRKDDVKRCRDQKDMNKARKSERKPDKLLKTGDLDNKVK